MFEVIGDLQVIESQNKQIQEVYDHHPYYNQSLTVYKKDSEFEGAREIFVRCLLFVYKFATYFNTVVFIYYHSNFAIFLCQLPGWV